MNKQIAPLICLAILILFQGVTISQWIFASNAVQGTEELDYLPVMQRYESETKPTWSHPILKVADLVRVRSLCKFPNLPFVMGEAAYLLFGRSLTSLRLMNLAFFLLAILLVFLIGRKSTNAWGGVIAATLLACYPQTNWIARFFDISIITVSMVALSLWLLMKTNRLHSFAYSLLFGMALGLTLITERGTPPLILVAPVAVYCVQSLYDQYFKSPRVALRSLGLLLLALGIVGLIAGPYLVHYLQIDSAGLKREIFTKRGATSLPGLATFHGHGHYYIKISIRELIGIPGALLLLFGSFLFLVQRSARKLLLAVCMTGVLVGMFFNVTMWVWYVPPLVVIVAMAKSEVRQRWLWLVWIFIPLILFSSFAQRLPVYLIAVLPAVALVTSAFLILIADQRYKKILIACLVVASFLASALPSLVNLSLSQAWINEKEFNVPPVFHRLFRINTDYFPKSTAIPDLATKVLESLPEHEAGILLYFPEDPAWFNMIEPDRIFLPFWFKELQINLNYQAPEIGHVIFLNPFPQKSTWAEPNLDLLAWIPLPRDQIRPYWQERFSAEEFPIRFLTTTEHAMIDLGNLPRLPGKTVMEFDFFEGRRLRITQLEVEYESEESF